MSKGTSLLILGAIVFAGVFSGCSGPTQAEMDVANFRIAALQQQLTDTLTQLQIAVRQQSEGETRLKSLQLQLDGDVKQLDEDKKTIANLQQRVTSAATEIAALKAPPLVANTPVISKGSLGAFQRTTVSIDLQAFEQAQGDMLAGSFDLSFYVQDPAGVMVRDFGKVPQTNFQIIAQIPGRYTVFIGNPYSNASIDYTLRYTVYHK